jgi:hypothetical protein
MEKGWGGGEGEEEKEEEGQEEECMRRSILRRMRARKSHRA